MVMNTQELAEHLLLINSYTDYEMIEIEQVDARANNIQGIQILQYNKLLNDSDPLDIVTSDLNNVRLDGGSISFVRNPHPRSRKPVGTGRVAYIINDNLVPPKDDYPDGFLSGAEKGLNVEFLASHYGEELWKIIDPKWEEIVRKRHDVMVAEKAKKAQIKHRFDGKYKVKGIGTDPDVSRISIEPSDDITNALKAIQLQLNDVKSELNEVKDENKKLKSEKTRRYSKKPRSNSKPQTNKPEEKPVESEINNFAT